MKIRVLLAIILTSLAFAVEIPFEPAFPAIEKVIVPAGEPESYSDVVQLPAVPVKPGKSVVLKVNLRMGCKSFGGWNNWSAIELNDHEINRSAPNGTPRLLLRGPIMHTTHPREKLVPYWREGSHNLLLTIFAPENETKNNPQILDSQYGYEYYFDVDDMVSKLIIGADDRIENNAPNKFRFLNALSKHIVDLPLVAKDIQLGYVPTAELFPLKGIKFWKTEGLKSAAGSIKGDNFQLNVSPYGGMELQMGENRKLYFESSFSYPASPFMKYNRLALDSVTGMPGIQAKVSQQGQDVVVEMTTPDLTLKRVIASKGHFIRVTDTFTNLGSEDRGLLWRNEAAFDNRMPAPGWRLAGLSNCESASVLAASNPTIYISDGECAAGIVAEDTVSRILINMQLQGNALVMGNTGVGIGPGNSLTIEWSIYPLQAPNIGYFDFVNRLRIDWNVNDTIPGPFLFSAKDLPGLKPRFACVGPWFEYSNGQELTRDEYSAKVLPVIEEQRKNYPGIILMALIETNLVKFDARTVPWGDQLPLGYGDRKHPNSKYGLYLSPELSAKLKAATPMADSLLCDKDGNVMMDGYYTYVNKPFINMMPQPAPGNYRFKQMMEQIDFLLEIIKFDGIYIDQFNPTYKDGISYDKWDGVSVVLDETGKIISKYYNYAIVGSPARMEIIKRITSAGKYVLTNGHPVTREEQSCGRLSFAEMENDSCNPLPFLDRKPPEFRYQSLGHLTSPIILNLRPGRYQTPQPGEQDKRALILNKGIITAIRNAQLPYYYGVTQPLTGPDAGSFEVANWLFPFTPVRIDEGVMTGKERTITVISGTFKLGGNAKPKIAHFNRYGIPTDASNITVTGTPGAWQAIVKLDDWNEIAVFEVVE
ncbi:MAG: hypothetical protein IKP00_08400 [Victivallales bacterium]|nr:hypothetical protein [Victivallales bacterium]